MRANQYGGRCEKCGKWVKPQEGWYLGWTEGVTDEDGRRVGSHHMVEHRACPPQVERVAVVPTQPLSSWSGLEGRDARRRLFDAQAEREREEGNG